MTDLAMIRRTASILYMDGTVAELRILDTPRMGTVAGYFDDMDLFAKAARDWSGKAPAVYATLNPCKPALLARAANRTKDRSKTATSDSDILQRYWFPLDFDPVRPAAISSTEGEHAMALARSQACAVWLQARGWAAPVAADSGNGAHLLYAINLPNDDTSKALLQRCLESLAIQFSDDAVVLDLGVFNASRIWKVYGTLACKGDNMPDRPHRLARLLEVPAYIERVTQAQLAAVASLVPETSASTSRRSTSQKDAFDLARWIEDHGLSVVSHGPWQRAGYRWVLNPCPWDSAHTDKAAFIAQLPSGAIAAGCHHNGCAGNDWEALRRQYEPDWTPYRERPPESSASRNGSIKNATTPLSTLSAHSAVYDGDMEINSLMEYPIPFFA